MQRPLREKQTEASDVEMGDSRKEVVEGGDKLGTGVGMRDTGTRASGSGSGSGSYEDNYLGMKIRKESHHWGSSTKDLRKSDSLLSATSASNEMLTVNTNTDENLETIVKHKLEKLNKVSRFLPSI